MNRESWLEKTKYGLLVVFAIAITGCSDSQESISEATEETAPEPMQEVAVQEEAVEAAPEPEAEFDSEANKFAVRLYRQDPWSPAAQALLAEDHVSYRAQFQNLAVNGNDPAIVAVADPLNVAIPDRIEVVEQILAEDDIVGVQTRIYGTHLGNLYGIPATGKPIELVAAAFYRLADGKIVESWEMADEAGLLRQIGAWLPERSDGLTIAPEINYPTRLGSEVLAEIMAEPSGTDTHTNKVRVSAYKSEIRPADQIFDGRPYEVYDRAGFFHIGDRGRALDFGDEGMRHGIPDRLDRVGMLIAEDNKVMIQFLVTGNNTDRLYGIPASNNPVEGWEIGFHTFEGTTWTNGWWFGDDIGLMLQIDAPKEFMVPELAMEDDS